MLPAMECARSSGCADRSYDGVVVASTIECSNEHFSGNLSLPWTKIVHTHTLLLLFYFLKMSH